MNSVYPAERWDYIIAKVSVLGTFRDGLKTRSTRPILPGSKVEIANKNLLKKFLGISENGLNIGKIRQSELFANISIDRLLQKHLAILSISGGGKSYTTSVIIEEILRRDPTEGRPALMMFDVHGEYRGLESLSSHHNFQNMEIVRIQARDIKMSLGTIFSTEKYRPWLDDSKSDIEWYYWNRYKRFLGKK